MVSKGYLDTEIWNIIPIITIFADKEAFAIEAGWLCFIGGLYWFK